MQKIMRKINNSKSKEAFKPWEENDKKRLKVLRNKDKWECARCQNQTFIIVNNDVDFPFFECICSQCGCIHIRRWE